MTVQTCYISASATKQKCLQKLFVAYDHLDRIQLYYPYTLDLYMVKFAGYVVLFSNKRQCYSLLLYTVLGVVSIDNSTLEKIWLQVYRRIRFKIPRQRLNLTTMPTVAHLTFADIRIADFDKCARINFFIFFGCYKFLFREIYYTLMRARSVSYVTLSYRMGLEGNSFSARND